MQSLPQVGDRVWYFHRSSNKNEKRLGLVVSIADIEKRQLNLEVKALSGIDTVRGYFDRVRPTDDLVDTTGPSWQRFEAFAAPVCPGSFDGQC